MAEPLSVSQALTGAHSGTDCNLRAIRYGGTFGPENTVKGLGHGVGRNALMGEPHPGFDLGPGSHGATPKTAVLFGLKPRQVRQPGQPIMCFNSTALPPTESTSSPKPDIIGQIAALHSAVAALDVRLSSLSDKTDARNPVPTQQIPQTMPGMSMKLPIDVPLFSGTGDQDFRTWIRLFERSARACKVTSTIDLMNVLDVFLSGPPARVFQNVQKLGVNTYEGMKTQLAEQFGRNALVSDASRSFMSRTQKVGERIIEFATDLCGLAEEAYPEIPPERIDFLLKDRFISGVLPEFIRWCEFDQCASFEDAFDCARRTEVRVFAAQAAQKLPCQNQVRVSPIWLR